MLEKELEEKITAYAKRCGCLCYKFVSPGQRGVPDRIVIAPNGRVGFIEVKREGQKPDYLQIRELEKLWTFNVPAACVDNLIDAKAFINNLMLPL